MRKPLVLALVGVGLVALVIGGVKVLTNKKQLATPSTSQTIQTLPSKTLTEYTDSSGISLNYPDDLIISASKDLDDTTYAQIQITSAAYPGSIMIRAADDKAKTLVSWISQNSKLASVESSQDIKLAGLLAKKLVTNDSIVTAALDSGVIFTVEVFGQKNQAYWVDAYNTIIGSFTIVVPEAPAAPSTNSTSGDDDVIFEGEEIIE